MAMILEASSVTPAINQDSYVDQAAHKAAMPHSHAQASKKIKLAAPQMAVTNSLTMAAYCKASVSFHAKSMATACSCTFLPNKWIT